MQDARLEQLVVQAGTVNADQLRIARQESQKNRTPIAEVLVNSGFIARHELRDLYAADMALPTVTLKSYIPDSQALALLPADRARSLCVFPLSADTAEHQLQVAVVDGVNLMVKDTIQSLLPERWSLSVCLATEPEILAAIDRCYGVELSIDGILAEMDGSVSTLPMTGAALVYTQPVVRLVDALLVDAIRRLASDIHFEPEPHCVRIRYRVDGVLRNVRSLHRDYWPSMLVRIKVLCAMNIAETRAPQDGHLSLMLEGRDVDFRASSFPALSGECVVIRVLDRHASILQLETLGFDSTQLRQLCAMTKHPQGLLLVTGPTGSGKTTTLYSLLHEIAGAARNIITMEDPVEYVLPQVRQCSVDGALKLDFADGVRAMLRQDPDVILVGETRDQATAAMVLRAALTGHLVLTTLHSASAAGAFYRLQDLGVKLGHLSGLLLGILAQRLVRALCETCKTSVTVPEVLQSTAPEVDCIYAAGSCAECDGTGYRGRLVVGELLSPDTTFHALLAADPAVGELVAAAELMGHRTLVQSALRHVAQGKTSVAEVQRVLGNQLYTDACGSCV